MMRYSVGGRLPEGLISLELPNWGCPTLYVFCKGGSHRAKPLPKLNVPRFPCGLMLLPI